MEEKIDNQKIFSYIPSLIARLILNSNLQDKDIFSDNTNKEKNITHHSLRKNSKGKSTFLTSLFINPGIYPINHYLPNTIVMNIRLKGFQKLISTLSIKDPKDQIEKMISEYLSIITPKFLLKIAEIISNNGGEIIKYNDYEFTTIWNFRPKKNKIPRYEKFYIKQALISACEIMKELDNKEIVNGIKIKISIGIAMGKTMIGFFGGERKRGEYIVMGETIENAEICLNYCLSHEVIISERINKLFIESDEITTREIENKENLNLYLITNFNENSLKNFKGFKIKMKSNKLNMTKTLYENLAKKVYIFSSILPQGLVKYLDVGQDKNLKEISVVTIATIHILVGKKIMNDLRKVQNIILDIQKATYLTFGSLLYISKTYNGLLVRCVWGMDPGSFLDDTARCLSTAILIGSLTQYYDIKFGIGITTGSCYTGLISIQGDRKQFTLLGKKVNLSRTLADEAFQKVINVNTKKKYIIYCDKKTMKQSQKWFRHIYISKITIYFNKDLEELYYEAKENDNNFQIQYNDILNFSDDEEQQNDDFEGVNKTVIHKATRNNTSLFGEYNRKNTEYFKKTITMNSLQEKISIINIEIYSPIENEEYFLQNFKDPFPLLRTHKHNSYTPKNNKYFSNHFKNKSYDNKINLKLIGNLPKKNIYDQIEIIKMKSKLEKSQKIFGYDKELNRFVNILNAVKQKNKKQILLIKGPLGAGKTLFVRNGLNQFLEENQDLKKIYFNSDDFMFFSITDPLTATFPYNIFCFIFRKIFFYIKKIKQLELINKLCVDLNLDNENIKYINFVLSMGKKDINIKEGFELKGRDSIMSFNERGSIISQTESMSIISELEGPHKIKDSNKIDNFFFEMIKIYKCHLNQKYNSTKSVKFKKSQNKTKNKVPLILVVDDIQMSDKYSMDFIRYLFNNDDNQNNPFIIILVEQTPFNKNYRPILHRELEFFLSAFSNDSDDEMDIIGNDKIININIEPIFEKDILKQILIENYQNYVTKYIQDSSKLESIDNKILDFLLMKTFQGIPLLVIELFKSLLESQKFIKLIDNEFKITEELIDDNEFFDWSNLFLPYIFEKITSMTINSLLSFKEILLVKYACTIGTIFDVQTLDKINPLNLIIKKEDLNNIMEKLSNEYIIEIFENERMNRKSKKYLICKICFPFMREVLHKKFPIEQRAKLHTEIAKLLSGGKKVCYFNSKIEGRILNRHLLYSEINVVKEIESRNYQDNHINCKKNNQIMNTNNLTVLLVKDICSRIFDRRYKNVLEGELEVLIEDKWIKISYFADRQWKMHFKNIKKSENEQEIELLIPIKDIYKTEILENNMLEITIVEYSFYILNENKEKALLRSDNWQDIFNLNTALSFLKMIAAYDKYIYNFGYSKFPLYKPDWYLRKEKKYYANIDQDQIVYFSNNFKQLRTKRLFSCFGLVNQTDKLITESKDINKPFNVIMRTTFSILIAYIQSQLGRDKNALNNEDEQKFLLGKTSYLLYIPTPAHVKIPIKRYLEEVARKQKAFEELMRLKAKGKFMNFPLSLIRQERRMFGSGVIEERRHQSISHSKTNDNDNREKSNSKFDTKKEEEKKQVEKKEDIFKSRKTGKSKTIIDTSDVAKELAPKIKDEPNIQFIDNEDSQSESESSKKSQETEKGKSSIMFSDSESQNTSQITDEDNSNNDKSEKIVRSINNPKTINPKIKTGNIFKKEKNANNKRIDITNNNDKKFNTNKNENIHYSNNDKKNTINFNNLNINNNNNQTNINTKNSYINNNININLINNNYIDSTIKKSFLNTNIINNNYNININSLRMSYQKKENKFLIKGKHKLKQKKKSNSAKEKSLKDKYRNSACLLLNFHSSNKMSLDDDDEEEDSVTSEKDSDNTASNLFSSPEIAKKHHSKIIPDLTRIKEDVFAKTIIAFLLDEKIIKNSSKSKSSKSREKKSKKVTNIISKPIEIDKNKMKGKRSSLCMGMKFQLKNKNKHVTFRRLKSDRIEEDYDLDKSSDSVPKKKLKKKDDMDNNSNERNNNIKRIKFNDKKE